MDNEFESNFNSETFNYENPEPEYNEQTVDNAQQSDAENFSEFNEDFNEAEPQNQSQVNDNQYNTYQSAQSQAENYHYPSGFQSKAKKEKKSGFKLGTLIATALLAAVIGASASLGVFTVLNNNTFNKENSGISSDNGYSGNSEININVDETAENAIEAVAQKVTPSVVGIRTTAAVISFFGGSTESKGEGSGIIYTKDGYIITNYHVIESAVTSSQSKISVFLSSNSEKEYEASVVGYNISHDLAVIKISAKNLPAIEIGNANKLKVGQFVAAIGSPGGLEFMGSVTYGIISGLNRVITDSNSNNEIKLIQTDAAINPGNSGGALVNIKGQLIGVNSSKIAATEFEGMGFAIPMDTVKDICDKIIDKENSPNPYIGIALSERYDKDTLVNLGFPEGAVVKSVVEGGPAYQAGIRSGDIIIEFNEKAISDYNDFYDAISATKPNQTVNVKIYRSRKYYTTDLKIGSNNSQ